MSVRSGDSSNRSWTVALSAVFFLLSAATAVAGQAAPPANGRIVGRVLDAATNEPLVSAMVTVVGTTSSTLTGRDGRYILSRLSHGDAQLRVQSIGYAPETAVVAVAGSTVEQDFSLTLQAVELSAINVTAGARRASVARGIEDQREATSIINAISAEQMSRSPDGNAATAMQRVSGVTVQDGKYISVRGLGERYTTTSLNGARLPSPDPERKVVPLDLFPSRMLESITTSKTFTPDQPGDFSGAQVDITTKKSTPERQVTFSSSFSMNDRVTGYSQLTAPRTGAEWLGFGAGSRALPGPLADAGDFRGQLGPSQYNDLVGSFRNAWSVSERTGTGSYSLGSSIGDKARVFGQDIDYLASLSYAYGEEVRHGEVRSRALAGGEGATLEVDRFAGSTGTASVLWGGMANVSTLIAQNTRLFLNTSYNRSADNEARFESGSSENLGNVPLHINRLKYVERSVLSSQLGAEHMLTDAHTVRWGVTASAVERNEPDRSEIVYAQFRDPGTGDLLRPTWLSVASEGAVRTFGALEEKALEADADYRISFGDDLLNQLKVGGLFRTARRDAFNRSYSIVSLSLPETARQLNPEEIFDGRFTAEGHDYFHVVPLGAGGTYDALENLAAGYGMMDIGLTDRIRLVAGARVEHSAVRVTSQGTVSTDSVVTEPTYTDVLPAVAFNVDLGRSQKLRLSLTQTLARPEYRELADVMYRDVLGGENVIGNPDLKRTLIRNADARWEWYPGDGEVLSVGVFGKWFENPIERVYRATSGTSVATFVNATSATNIGAELELRKRLGSMTVFSNVTLMNSRIDIAEAENSATNDERAMVGQAPYVVNAGVTYAPVDSDLSATALFNIVGPRITSAGEIPLPDVYEQARGVLDVSVRAPLRGGVSLKFDAKNLLDQSHEQVQGNVTREAYRTGRSFTFGVSWTR